MPTTLMPYLSFKDNAREAMLFYQSIFGGKLEVRTFKEFHASEDPAEAEKVMHSQLVAENGFTFAASDTPNSMEFRTGSRITMTLTGDNADELKGYFEKLAAGGTITMPLEPAPWADAFGMLTDKFGVDWMVNIARRQ